MELTLYCPLEMWLPAALIVFVSAILQAITGFGFALVSVPLLLQIFDAKTAASLTMLVSFTTLLTLTIRVRRAVVTKLVRSLFASGLIGVIAGVPAFVILDARYLKILITTIIILFTLLIIRGTRFPAGESMVARWVVGVTSGFFAASVSLPGPPVILYLNGQDLTKEQFRATASTYFTLVYPVSYAALISCGAITLPTIALALSFVGPALLGNLLGSQLFRYVPQRHFNLAVPLLVLASAAYALFGALVQERSLQTIML